MPPGRKAPDGRSTRGYIEVENARQNNLKGVSVRVPIGAIITAHTLRQFADLAQEFF